MSDELSIPDRTRLDELTGVVREGLDSFVRVGHALMQIKEDRLWREKSVSFEAFCQVEFRFTRRHADRMIQAAQVVEDISVQSESLDPGVQIEKPGGEKVVRPLSDVEPEKRAEVWKEAVETAPKDKAGKPKVTAKHVQKVVAKRKAARPEDGPAAKEAEPVAPPAAIDATEPWGAYNATLEKAQVLLSDVCGLILGLTTETGVGLAFAGWIDRKQYATFFADTIATLENHHVTRWATKAETEATPDKRNFRYVREEKKTKRRSA
jgi:hypothetical protein